MSTLGDTSCPPRLEVIVSRPPLIETIATADAQVDARCGEDQSYQAMEALFASGVVRQAAWDRYSKVYVAVRHRLAIPVPAPVKLRRRG